MGVSRRTKRVGIEPQKTLRFSISGALRYSDTISEIIFFKSSQDQHTIFAMGLIFKEVTFEETAPDPDQIAQAVTAASGLTVVWVGDEFADETCVISGQLRFEEFPDTWVELETYKPGAIKRCALQDFNEDDPIMGHIQGMHEPEGTQTVYLRGYALCEPTLLIAAIAGLEALGGDVIGEPISEGSSAQCPLPVTREELKSRRRAANRQALLVVVLNILLTPLVLLWTLVTLPYSIWKAFQISSELDKAEKKDP